MKRPLVNSLAIVLCVFMAACKEQSAGEMQPAPTDLGSDSKINFAQPDYSETDSWLGQWNGPEGTFLKLSGGSGKYEITIQNLDGPKTYSGISLDNKIQFERNGVLEKIRATGGEETGMKWLSEKKRCLTINRGEGFCRD